MEKFVNFVFDIVLMLTEYTYVVLLKETLVFQIIIVAIRCYSRSFKTGTIGEEIYFLVCIALSVLIMRVINVKLLWIFCSEHQIGKTNLGYKCVLIINEFFFFSLEKK